MSDEAYFCLVTWPDGKEGLLFPRPGNVPINTTIEDGTKDFDKAVADLKAWISGNPQFKDTKVSLVKFQRLEVVKQFPEPVPLATRVDSIVADMYACPRCRRQMTHSRNHGYICEYCAGIED
jgi:hypothetical protein